MEVLEYAYLQIGEDSKARQMVEAQRRISYDQVDPNLHDYVNQTFANSPALYALETRNWKAAEALRADPDFKPYNRAIIYWAQAVAPGHLRNLTTAQKAVERYDAMIEAANKGPKPYVVKHMTTRHDEAHAWLLLLQGHAQEATDLLRKIADKQDVEGKGEIETPAREMLADMLMETNRPADALAEYERSMKIDCNRFNGLNGAAHAAELLKEHQKERTYYTKMLQNCSNGNSQRPEVLHAKQTLQALR